MKRFWNKVDKRGPDDCWLWLAKRKRGGYGQFWFNNRQTKAHRVSWELANGPIPHHDSSHGMCVLHRCDNPPCVNPAHLFLGTNADNLADMVAKGRSAAGEAIVQSKLTEAQVREIRRLGRKGGITNVQIAKRFGITRANVGQIINGITWKHCR